MTEQLKQPTAFGPFRQEFVMFAEITGRTSNHYIIRPIRAATTQRNDMVSMVSTRALAKLIAAIVATIALSFELIGDILSSKGVTSTLLEYPTLMVCCTIHHPPLGRALIFLILFTDLITVQQIVLPMIFTSMFSMLSSILLKLFGQRLFVGFVVSLLILDVMFPILLLVLLLISKHLLPMRMVVLPASLAIFFSMGFKVLPIVFKKFLFMKFIALLGISITTILAVRLQAIFVATGSGKAGDRQSLFALGAAFLRYTITHGKGHSFSSRPWRVPALARVSFCLIIPYISL